MPWHSVCETCTGNSRIYWYNTCDETVSWDNPFLLLNQETQRVTEDVLSVCKTQSLSRILQYVIHSKLNSAFSLWVRCARSRIGPLVRALDSWMKMRSLVLFVLRTKEEVLEYNAIVNIRNELLEKELEDLRCAHDQIVSRLADAQVRYAQAEHDFLASQTRRAVQRV